MPALFVFIPACRRRNVPAAILGGQAKALAKAFLKAIKTPLFSMTAGTIFR
jgi:hypothetical protein